MSITKFLTDVAEALGGSSVTRRVPGVERQVLLPRNPSAPTRVTKHQQTSPRIVARNGTKFVPRDTTPLIEKRGWKKRGNCWRGHYASRQGTYEGAIERRGDIFHVQIKRPPAEVQLHTKWVCFHRASNGWWSIHLHHNPRDHDPSSIVAYVERVLAESFTNAKRRKS